MNFQRKQLCGHRDGLAVERSRVQVAVWSSGVRILPGQLFSDIIFHLLLVNGLDFEEQLAHVGQNGREEAETLTSILLKPWMKKE